MEFALKERFNQRLRELKADILEGTCVASW
jgi:hypothetical protein